MTTKYKIKLKSKNDVLYEEGTIVSGGSDILPGCLLAQTGAQEAGGTEVALQADNAAGSLPVLVAIARQDRGDTVATAYVEDGNVVQFYRAEVGQEYNLRFDAAITVAVGDYLTYGTNGRLQLLSDASTSNVAQFRAIEAKDPTVAGDLLAVQVIEPYGVLLSEVATDATLEGDGTAGDPLTVA